MRATNRAGFRAMVGLGLFVFGCRGGDGDGADDGTDATTDTAQETSAGETEEEEEPGEASWPTLACDPLVPEFCAYPFPSNVFTADDPGTPTGRRLALSRDLMPATRSDFRGPPDVFNERDGFSTHGSITALMPGMSDANLPGPWEYPASLESDSPTVLLDADTGERIAHFAELDHNGPATEPPALLIQPAAALAFGHRYIVAIRDVRDPSGNLLSPSPVFEALRDDLEHEDPSVAARRSLYRDIFARLEDAGIERDALQLAWDFTVASREDTSGRMLSMRDQALAAVPERGPTFEITSVEEDWSEHVFRYIEGEIEVPLFLDHPGPGAVLVLDEQGRPTTQGTARYPFVMLIPNRAKEAPVAGLLLGHGLFGSRYEARAAQFGRFADEFGYAIVALDWIGMSNDDPIIIAAALNAGRVDNFSTVPDRLQQSLVNFLLATRMMRTSFPADPLAWLDDEPLIDADRTYYYGGSQGGIMGSVYMALATDVERGVLAVPGQPYNLLLERSVNFDPFAELLQTTFATQHDARMTLALAQLLWDRAEPSGYSRHVFREPLPDTPEHSVLMLVSIGDHQVSTLGAHVMARTIGAVNLGPVNRDVWGLDVVEGSYEGSAMIEYDFGLPPEPIHNVPMREGSDPHGSIVNVPAAVQAVSTFLETGIAVNGCDGPCNPN
jgi:hypothetical protein